MKSILISVKPKFAHAILAGEKTVELRRRFSQSNIIGTQLFIYASSPCSSIIGTATISNIQKLSIDEIKKIERKSLVDEIYIDEYFSGIEFGYAIHLKNPRNLCKNINIKRMKEMGLTPPQSYLFLKNYQLSEIYNEK